MQTGLEGGRPGEEGGEPARATLPKMSRRVAGCFGTTAFICMASARHAPGLCREEGTLLDRHGKGVSPMPSRPPRAAPATGRTTAGRSPAPRAASAGKSASISSQPLPEGSRERGGGRPGQWKIRAGRHFFGTCLCGDFWVRRELRIAGPGPLNRPTQLPSPAPPAAQTPRRCSRAPASA